MEYTIADNAETVSVSEFRFAIFCVENKIHDLSACVGKRERSRWLSEARATGARLIATTCKRAKREDWERRERAIDRSAALICRVSEEIFG